MAYPLQNSNSGGAHVSILETFSRFDAHLGASGGFWCGSWVVLGWCWVLCAGSWVSFLRFPLWEFHVKAICFHVRVSFDKTSQLLRRFGMRSSSSTSSSCCSSSDSTPAPDLAPASDSAPAPDSTGHTVANLLLPLAVLVLVHSVPSTTFI